LPLYEYACLKCKRHTDKIENLNGPHLKKCPHCGGKVESVITAPSIQFKGTGWYVTDYGKKTAGGDSSKSDTDKGEKSAKADKSEKSEKSEKSDSKSTSQPKEQKKTGSASKEK
jgi:putative FmdB family regulatory protein